MAREDHWLVSLVNILNEGCLNSQFILDLKSGGNTLDTGKELSLALWPFISRLPQNIKTVKHKIPPSFDYALKFFDQLSDDEGYYQGLYKKQCQLAGIEESELGSACADLATQKLTVLLSKQCNDADYKEGIVAVVTAELAATVFARHSLDYFESHFESYPETAAIAVEEGLAWLRLHAKPHTRHAIWMRRAVDSLELDPPNKIPSSVENLVAAIYAFWRCPEELSSLELNAS